MSVMTCEVCKDAGVQTKIPYDEVGIALMQEHFAQEHPEVVLPPYKPRVTHGLGGPSMEISDRWYPR